jgi:hypothetical protein
MQLIVEKTIKTQVRVPKIFRTHTNLNLQIEMNLNISLNLRV